MFGRADGVQWRKTFKRSGHALGWKERLDVDRIAGLPFDLRTKQFVRPKEPKGPHEPTVFELTEDYFHQHPEWEPRTKVAAAASLNRARRWLLATDPSPGELAQVADYLAHASFLPEHLAGGATTEQLAGRLWLERHSASAGSLTPAQVEAFVARFEVNQRNPAKRVSATTVTLGVLF